MPGQMTSTSPRPIDLDGLVDQVDTTGRQPVDDLRGPAPPETRTPAALQLRRSRDDKVIAGVCGGLGRYLGIDPVLLRIAFVLLTIGAGSGVLLYVIAWIVIPEQHPDEVLGDAPTVEPNTGRLIIGGALVLLGAALLLRRVAPWFDDRVVWPLVLIAIGALVALKGAQR